MLSAVLQHLGRIFSLRLLLEDTKVLEPATRMIKLLIPNRHGESIKASMKTCFRISKQHRQERRGLLTPRTAACGFLLGKIQLEEIRNP